MSECFDWNQNVVLFISKKLAIISRMFRRFRASNLLQIEFYATTTISAEDSGARGDFWLRLHCFIVKTGDGRLRGMPVQNLNVLFYPNPGT